MSGGEEMECVQIMAGGVKLMKIEYLTIPQQKQAEVHN